MPSNQLRLVVVDDHALFRRGLVGLLSDMPEFTVVGEASNGHDAVAVVEQTRPDVILMDLNMPVMDGLAAVEEIRRRKLPVRVLMLTISQNDQDLLNAIKAGADGYLLKNAEPEALRDGLLRVGQGQGVLSPEVTGAVMKAIGRHTREPEAPVLSDRELEVMGCLALGETTAQIAAHLFISENTVKTHIRHILEKLDASNRTEAVGKALALGLIRNDGEH